MKRISFGFAARAWKPIAMAAVFALAGCGGGGGGGGGGFPLTGLSPTPTPVAGPSPTADVPSAPAPGPSGSTPNPSNPNPNSNAGPDPVVPTPRPMVATTYSYKAGSAITNTADAIVTELNSPEMAGFNYYGTYSIDDPVKGAMKAIYQKKGDTAGYEFRLLPFASLSLANYQLQGKDGYLIAWEATQIVPNGSNGPMLLHRKPIGQTTTYDFVDVDAGVKPEEADAKRLETLNRLGQQGYCKFTLAGGGGPIFIAGREVPTASRCVFETVSTVGVDDNFKYMAQLNAQGAKGGRFALNSVRGNERVNVFARDESQQATFRFHAVETTLVKTTADWLALYIREGATGSKFVTSFVEGGVSYAMFMTAYDCKGMLCD